MAWFNKKKEQTVPTPALTFERVIQWFERKDYHFDVAEDGRKVIETGFDGYYCIVNVEHPDLFLSVYTFASGVVLSEDRFDEAVRWANQWNTDKVFGTARPFVDDEHDLVLRIDTSFLVEEGVTDAQLDEMLECAVSGNLGAIEDYINKMGIEHNKIQY